MELWEEETEPEHRAKHALGWMAAGGGKRTLSPARVMLGLSQACPLVRGSALHSCPVGMGDSSWMSTIQPGRVCPHLSCSWEVTGTLSSMGIRQAYVLC